MPDEAVTAAAPESFDSRTGSGVFTSVGLNICSKLNLLSRDPEELLGMASFGSAAAAGERGIGNSSSSSSNRPKIEGEDQNLLREGGGGWGW
jgi:hypothetical protein